MADLNYEAGDEQMEDYRPLPADTYQAMITDSKVEPTKAKTGTVLKLTWTVTDGEYTNRKVFDRINLANPNAKAVEIGRKQLNTICHAAGLRTVGDSTELHDRPCLIDVRVKPADGQYAASNEVRGYHPMELEGAGVGAPAAPAPAQNRAPATPAAQRPAPAPVGKLPWQKK